MAVEDPQALRSVGQRSFLDPSEFIAALEALTDSELLRLHKKADYRAQGSGMEGDDLFQEAILRTLEEDGRKCPSDVPVAVYLDNAMRSIADGEREKYMRERPSGAARSEYDEGPIAAAADPATLRSNRAFDRVQLTETVDYVQEIFKEDLQAQAVVMGDMEGWSADEIKDLVGIGDQQYAAARKSAVDLQRNLANEDGHD